MARIDERRQWINRQPHKLLYTGKTDNLRTCVLCGNRFPFTRRWFHGVKAENVRGFINEGLLQVCLGCIEHWGDTLNEDVTAISKEVKAARARGDMRPIVPLAKRKKKG